MRRCLLAFHPGVIAGSPHDVPHPSDRGRFVGASVGGFFTVVHPPKEALCSTEK